jgi:hypothetical protein
MSLLDLFYSWGSSGIQVDYIQGNVLIICMAFLDAAATGLLSGRLLEGIFSCQESTSSYSDGHQAILLQPRELGMQCQL